MRAISIAIACVLFGCSKAPEPSPPVAATAAPGPLPQSIVPYITPADISSNIGGTPLQITFRPTVADNIAKDTASRVQLRTYPDLGEVPFATLVHQPSTTPSDGPYLKDGGIAPPPAGPAVTTIDVVPKNPLAIDRWYVLSISSLPTGVTPNSMTSSSSVPKLGAYASRFTIGRTPVIQAMRGTTSGQVLLDFSENVAIDDSTIGLFLSVLDDTHASCTYIPNAAHLPTMRGLQFQCAQSMYVARSGSIKLAPGLKNDVGVPLGTLVVTALDKSSLVDSSAHETHVQLQDEGQGYRGWRP